MSGNNLARLTPEQRGALADWARAMQAAAPRIQEIGKTAKDIRDAIVNAPQWRIVEGEPLPGHEIPTETVDPWNTGGPTVNYVDHIEPINERRES